MLFYKNNRIFSSSSFFVASHSVVFLFRHEQLEPSPETSKTYAAISTAWVSNTLSGINTACWVYVSSIKRVHVEYPLTPPASMTVRFLPGNVRIMERWRSFIKSSMDAM